jgi:hypothetical protein
LHSDGTTFTSSTSPTVNYITATSTTATSTFSGGFTAGGASGLTVLQNGNVEIGTTVADGRLTVVGVQGNNTLVLDTAPNATGQSGILNFQSSFNSTSATFDAARIKIYGTAAGYGTAANYLGFDAATGSNTYTTYMAMSLAGNVGIGTTSPYSKLSVWGSGTGTGQAFEITNNASTTIAKFLDNGTGYFLGNIGIGTTTPYAKLSVVGQVVADYFSATSTTATSTFAGDVNVGSGALTYTNSSGVIDIATLNLGAQSFESDAGIISWADMPVTSTSVATTVNSYSAQIDGNPLLTIYSESDGAGGILNTSGVGIGTTTPYAKLSVVGTGIITPTFAIASSSGQEYLRVSAFGNLGLGTSTPAWLMQLASSTAPQLALTDSGAGANLKHWILRSVAGSLFFATSSDAYATSTTAALTLSPNGYMGLGTTSPYAKLSVAGTVAMSALGTSQGNAICITAGGEVTNPGAASCTGSSEKFKDRIETLAQGFALDELTKLRAVSFDYKDGAYSPEDLKGSYGMIAEEVEKIDPKLVDYGYDNKPLTLKFEKFVGLFVQAIQELVARVTGLEDKFNAQQAEIESLKARMNAFDGQTAPVSTPTPEPIPEPEPIVEPEPIPETSPVIEPTPEPSPVESTTEESIPEI